METLVMPTMIQFFHDHITASDEVKTEDFTPRAALIQKLCDNYRKNPEENDIIISGELTGNGGNITFYNMLSLSSRSNENECRNHFKATVARSVLIEPVGYPAVEPYNRQSPYYLPLGSGQFAVATTTNVFNVYKQIGEYRTNLFTSFDEYHYNNYWLSVTFGLAIERERIAEFLIELHIILEPFGYSSEVMEAIISFEESTRISNK